MCADTSVCVCACRVFVCLCEQEILADAVERLSPPEKRGSVIRNSANVVSFEEGTDPATGGCRQAGRQFSGEGQICRGRTCGGWQLCVCVLPQPLPGLHACSPVLPTSA